MGSKNLLFESIFNRGLSEADTRDYLMDVTAAHPYFIPAQFFLLLQTEKGTKAYEEQVAKSVTLFNNAHWLKYQLEEIERMPSQIDSSFTPTSEQFVSMPSEENNSSQVVDFQESAVHTELTDNFLIELTDMVHQTDEPVYKQEALYPVTESKTEYNTIAEHAEAADEISATETAGETKILGVFNELQHLDQEKNTPEISGGIAVGKVIDSAVTDLKSPEKENEKMDHPHNTHFNNDDSPLINETEEEDIILDEEAEPMKFRLTIDKNIVTEDTISFEPLHTSDYFASLGIKLSGEIQPTDKLGKQLKSFTEWLKTMKKIHSDQLPQQTGQAELTVQNLAEKSNKNEEVVTESMADVLLQQGKIKKAIEVLNKLSLLDTSKSAYFAAKIDQLKEH